jgi:alkaline phosphatase
MSKKSLLMVLAVLVLFGSSCFGALPKNIIVLIGDGMGFEQVKAAGMYANGTAGTLCFESFPYTGEVTTYCANNPITDSAAAGTAIATGVKVDKKVISIRTPGDGSELQTMLEYFKARNKMVGLVSTTYITHATPAAFGSHELSRNNYANIAVDLLNQTQPDVLLGGAKYVTASAAIAAGYIVVTDSNSLLAVDTNAVTKISGQFGADHMPYESDGLGTLPHLSEMTAVAIDILDEDPDGFFLMVEGGRIDHAGHKSNLVRNVHETIEFANSVQKAIDWAQGRDDTLIVVTADHETGGLQVVANNGKGVLPTVNWTSGGNHTGVNVPVYAMGVNAEQITPVMDNTDFFGLVTTIIPVSPDFNGDGRVDIVDLSVIAQNWLRVDCTLENDWCSRTDLDRHSSVGPEDINIFAAQWLGHL